MNAHADFTKTTKARSMTVDIADLRSALTWTNKVRQARNTIPVLGMHRFDVNGNSLGVTTTDLDTRTAGDLRLRGLSKGDPARLTNEDNPDLLYILMPMRV